MKITTLKIILLSLALSLFLFVQPASAQTWLPLNNGITSSVGGSEFGVYDMFGTDSALFVGGQYNVADVANVYDIAEWNAGDTAWFGLGNGIGEGLEDTTSFVSALTVYKGNLYAAGFFSIAGTDSTAYNIAEWNGSVWSGLGSGIGSGASDFTSQVYAIDTLHGNLFVGGFFDTAGGTVPANNIARWSDSTSSWSKLGFGIGTGPSDSVSVVNALANYHGNLYAGGYFKTAGESIAAYNIAVWQDSLWAQVGAGIGTGDSDTYSVVYAMAVYNGNLYVAGQFQVAGDSIPAYNIAVWNDSTWSFVDSAGIGGGLHDSISYVTSLYVFNGVLYAGGFFSEAGGNGNIYNIAAWNGTTWSPLGDGIGTGVGDETSEVFSITSYQQNLYAGGNFTVAGDSIPANNIAEYIPPVSGIRKVVSNSSVSIVPNPNNGLLNVVLQNVTGTSELEIFDVLGGKIYQSQLTSANTSVDLTNRADGVYFYRISTLRGDLISSGKFIIQ